MNRRSKLIVKLFTFMITFMTGLAISLILLAVRTNSIFIAPAPAVVEQSRSSISDDRQEEDGYYLRSNATQYQTELFQVLLNAQRRYDIEQSSENLLDYATAVAKNFIADFFTFSNKDSRSDVGGLQFVAEDVRENFQTYAVDNFYLYLNHYIEMFGSEVLPEIVDIAVDNVGFEMRYVDAEGGEYLDEPVQTIIVDVTWNFAQTTLEEIDEFQTRARIILIEMDEGPRVQVIEELDSEPEIVW